MGWSMYTARFGATRPAFLPAVADPEAVADSVRAGLDWMFPEVTITADTATVRLSMNAPSAEAALAHLRGSYKSALHTAGVWQVGNWPLHLLTVEAGLPSEVRAAAGCGTGPAGTVHGRDGLHLVG
ncbi:hypothetical protein [Streptomyces viridosporus]|uniref:hypothetical protein n=1 Tax=Streptomyces viridosporus TaxID=67581 RepID=UPI0009BF5D9B|nr:hypothetical protein [Streptomyces viridosporus]